MQVFVFGVPGFQALDRNSFYRIQHRGIPSQRPVIGDIPLGSDIIFVGVGNIIPGAVTCVRIISQNANKMVAEVEWADGRTVAKCWAPEYYERFSFHCIIFKDVY